MYQPLTLTCEGKFRHMPTTARITNHSSILVAHDVPATIAYWQKAVGFELVNSWGEPARFAILKRDGARVMIGLAPPDHHIIPYWRINPGLWNAYFWIDDAQAMYEELKGRGAHIDYTPHLQDYGVLEFGIQDLEGHDIGFGQVLNETS